MAAKKKFGQRVFDRKNFRLEVALLDENGRAWLLLPVSNLSSNGLAMDTIIPFPRGMRLFLQLPLGEGGVTLSLHAEVLRLITRKNDDGTLKQAGVGLRFLHLKARELLMLEEFLGR